MSSELEELVVEMLMLHSIVVWLLTGNAMTRSDLEERFLVTWFGDV